MTDSRCRTKIGASGTATALLVVVLVLAVASVAVTDVLRRSPTGLPVASDAATGNRRLDHNVAVQEGAVTAGSASQDGGQSEPPTESQQQQQQQQSDEEHERLVANMKARMTQPRALVTADGNAGSFRPNQFLHLHHMKTGGTSMDTLIRCVVDNVKRIPVAEQDSVRMALPYKSLHECSRQSWQYCLGNAEDSANNTCQQAASQASVMSYCAPLRHLPHFGWNQETDFVDDSGNPKPGDVPGFGAVTILRDPVERVWSMYRFQTKYCYECRPLLDIYREIDEGVSQLENLCKMQLVNHQVANLLSTESSLNACEQEQVAEAVHNMKYFFTMIGLTEELPATVDMLKAIFPWMEDVTTLSDRPVDASAAHIRPCTLPHANSSPKNNRCNPGNTHMDLPPHPDEATRAAIEAHNQLDIQLYEAAVEHFQLQKQVMGLD